MKSDISLKEIHRFKLKNSTVFLSGNTNLLKEPKIAIFTSRKIPLTLILPAEDFILSLKKAVNVFIGGWHSPFEKRVFKKLIENGSKLILFTPKGLKDFKLLNYMVKPYEENRLLIASLSERGSKITLRNSLKRNKIVSEIADYNLFIFIDKKGNLENLFEELINQGKIPLIFGHPTNSYFFDKGKIIDKSNFLEVLK